MSLWRGQRDDSICFIQDLPAMGENDRERAFALIRELLSSLESLVDGQRWNLDGARLAAWRENPWQGADVVVCDEAPSDNPRGHTHVVTPFTGELSWLVENLKDICGQFLDFRNKYAFYGRLADAANRYHAEREGHLLNAKDLCFAVIREARRMVDEEQQGFFEDRDVVRIRGVRVMLFPDGAPGGVHQALYHFPVDDPINLEGVAFTHRGEQWRMGETRLSVSDGMRMTVVAEYHVDRGPSGKA